MAIFSLANRTPLIDPSAYVCESAMVIGSVQLAARTSVWFNAVLRGDNDDLILGVGSNVQDGAILHTDEGLELRIGDGCTIGHQAMLHGCQIGDGSLIGMQAIILNGAVIGKNCLIGAGAIVTEGKQIPDRSLVLGAPGKVVRTFTDNELERFRLSAENYVQRAAYYRLNLKRIDQPAA